jgi:perosamine synthetase
MLVTDDDDYAQRASLMRLHGISGDAWKRYSREGSWFYEVEEAGYKANLPDLLAALGRVQLKKADGFWRARYAVATRYLERFSQFEELQMPQLPSEGSEHAWHLFILRIRPELLTINRNAFIHELARGGVGTSVHFIPLHRHPFYVREYGCRREEFPHAEDAYNRCVSLPIYPDLSEGEILRVMETVERVVYENRKTALVAAS